LRGEDAVRATVRKMSASEADEVACSVVRLFAAIVRECATDNAYAAVLHGSGKPLNGKALSGTAANGTTLNGFAANGARAKNGTATPQAISL
jgi:hypothetical protein